MAGLRTLAAAAIALMLGLGQAFAAEAGSITVEFNDLQVGEAGCRAVFVMNNGLDKPIAKLGLRVVAFDKEGHAKLFLSLDAGTLPVGKTRILRFDLGEGVACDGIGRLVLDDVTACDGAGLDPATCLAAVSLTTKTGTPFDL